WRGRGRGAGPRPPPAPAALRRPAHRRVLRDCHDRAPREGHAALGAGAERRRDLAGVDLPGIDPGRALTRPRPEPLSRRSRRAPSMTTSISRESLSQSLPDLRGPVRVPGLGAGADVWRDPEGVPHVRAASGRVAFLAEGFVHAQDRLWHMEYDRRRAAGRWAEYAGSAALAQDVQMRRFRLVASARADYAVVDGETRAMLDAYAAGINAFLATTAAWPVELGLLGVTPEPWQPWDSLAVFKVRHVLMGVWQTKAWRARMLRHLGPARMAELCPGTQPNPLLIVPPGVEDPGPAPPDLPQLTPRAAGVAPPPQGEDGRQNRGGRR